MAPPVTKTPHPNAPDAEHVLIRGVSQEQDGPQYHLRGAAEIETTDSLLQADEIDYDSDNDYAEARGHVRYTNYEQGEKIEADRAEYHLDTKRGKYYNVRGETQAKIDAKPGLLTTSNPFHFEAKWAERIEDRYLLHNGFITNCKVERPWWKFHSPNFDVIPNNRAIAHQAIFRLRGVPIFYTPYFYKSLEKFPRKSGFLQPNIGNSSRRGTMLGLGYYWAINRSYDLTYRNQWFTERGFAHTFDFRGKPTATSDFNFYMYGVNDQGAPNDDGSRDKSGGYLFTFTGKANLGHGWTARAFVNHLSSFAFRQQFTDSYTEAVATEVHSVGYVTKHWETYGINLVIKRDENFFDPISITNANGRTVGHQDREIIIQRLPQLEFIGRERPLWTGPVPVWFSFAAVGGVMHRDEPEFTRNQYVERVDVSPRVTTAFHWAGLSLVPSFTMHETHYSAQLVNNKIQAGSLLRNAPEFNVELILPSLERIFTMHNFVGEKLKHVIEPRAQFRSVSGVKDFARTVRFDELDTLNDTREVEFSITNRFYAKKKNGEVNEVASWELRQRRYFDPQFGGALVQDTRNVLWSTIDVTPYSFIDRPRNFSPLVSTLRIVPDYRVSLEWRADYDPARGQLIDSGFNADARWKKYYFSAGQYSVQGVPSQPQRSNQMRAFVGYGNDNRSGWNVALTANYDYTNKQLQYTNTQVGYNTDCCGFNVQYRHFAFGPRHENHFVAAFVIANIGSFGTLKRQERIF